MSGDKEICVCFFTHSQEQGMHFARPGVDMTKGIKMIEVPDRGLGTIHRIVEKNRDNERFWVFQFYTGQISHTIDPFPGYKPSGVYFYGGELYTKFAVQNKRYLRKMAENKFAGEILAHLSDYHLFCRTRLGTYTTFNVGRDEFIPQSKTQVFDQSILRYISL